MIRLWLVAALSTGICEVPPSADGIKLAGAGPRFEIGFPSEKNPEMVGTFSGWTSENNYNGAILLAFAGDDRPAYEVKGDTRCARVDVRELSIKETK